MSTDPDYSDWTNSELVACLARLQRRVGELEPGVSAPEQDGEPFEDRETRFKTLFKNSPLPIFVWRREGDDFVRVDHNDAAQDLVGEYADRTQRMMASEVFADWPQIIVCMRQCFTQRETVTDFRRRSIPQTAPARWFDSTFVFVPPI